MPGKQARVLCPVCQEPIPPDETECENCGAFVMDEAIVRLSRAFGLDREKALRLFEAGFRHPKQLKDRDPDRVLERGEVGLLFICTNCGSFVSTKDTKCPRCAAEFEVEAEAPVPEEDILDIVLCPVCGADNDPELAECEICGEVLKAPTGPGPAAAAGVPSAPPTSEVPRIEKLLDKFDAFLQDLESSGASMAKPAAPPSPVPPPPPPALREGPATKPASTPPKALLPKPTLAPPPSVPAPAPRPLPTMLAPARPSARPAAHAPPARPIPARPSPAPALEIQPRPPPAPPSETTVPPALELKRVRAAVPHLIPRKKIRAVARTQIRISAETAGALVLASAGSLLLAGALNEPFVGGAIALFLVGIAAYLSVEYRRGGGPRPSMLDGLLLALAAVLGSSVPLLSPAPIDPVAMVILAGSAAFPFAIATRRLLRSSQRILLATVSAIPIIGYGLATVADPGFAMTLPWTLGMLAAMPWPAALAATEILRRNSASILRRELVRAEQDMQRKNYERSLAEYDRAIAVARPGVTGAEIPWYGKGATLVLLGRYEEALRAIDTALDINPRNEVAWLNKGNALTKLGRLEDALRCFNAAIQVNPRYEVAWNNKGNALARLGRFEESVACYESALDIDSGYRGAWVNMGFVLTKLGRFDEAASCADRALRSDPSRRADPI